MLRLLPFLLLRLLLIVPPLLPPSLLLGLTLLPLLLFR
jgi:hypothetical protein